MKKLLFSLFVVAFAATNLFAGNVITYTATSKLTSYIYDDESGVLSLLGSPKRIQETRGLNSDAFNVPISSHTFSNGIGTITFTGEVTTIGYKAFYHCDSLTSITIPSSVTTIGMQAFYGCSGSVTCEATTPPTCGSYCFSIVDLYVPAQSITAYKQANEWKDFYRINSIEQVLALVNNSAYGSVRGGGHQKSENVTLTASPKYGYHFTQWSDGNTENPRSFVLTQDTTFTAEFAKNIYSFDVQTADSVMGSVTGAILSAFVLTILQELLRFLRDYRLLIYPLILICMMLFRPQGLLGTAELCFFKIPDYFKAIGRWFKKIFSKKSKEAE